MKKIFLSFIALLSLQNITSQNGTKPLQLKQIVNGEFSQKSVGEMRSLPDGIHYTAMNPARTMIIKYAYKTGEPVDTLFNVKKARECSFDKFDGYEINSTGHRILLWKDTESIYRRSTLAQYYDYDVRRNMVSKLTENETKQTAPLFSPDGRMCAFVVENNIWIKKFDYNTEIQITKDGAINQLLNGTTDWVYEEEFGTTQLMSWSEDSKILAYVKTDESQVPTFCMQMFEQRVDPTLACFKYPYAGQTNSSVSVHAYNLESKDTKALNVPLDADGYIPQIKFTKNPEQLAVMTLNRDQNKFQMYYVNPKSAVSKMVLQETSETYIDSENLYTIEFYDDCFTYVSEKDGWSHVYLYSPTGVLLRQATKGKWDVTRLIGYDPKLKTVYYEAADKHAFRRSVMKTDAKGVTTTLSPKEGMNSAEFSANFMYYVNKFSNVNTPLEVTLYDAKAKPVRVLQDNEELKAKLAQYRYPTKEFIKISTASGQELNAWMIKPLNFDPNTKYPVLMTQYSGPNSQQVLDRYGFDWDYYLGSNGYVVVCVDGRGTGARGESFRKCTYMRLGLLEATDQVEAAQALGKMSFIDENRMAIWGWSFGGYNTLMSLTIGEGTFKTGMAVAPVTDWRFYDSVYTERFMRTPKQNEDGYNITSPLKRASELQGNLLLVHGTADDNVHYLNTLEYAEALVQANKQFDMQIYTDKNHSIYGGNTRFHLYTRLYNFLQDKL